MACFKSKIIFLKPELDVQSKTQRYKVYFEKNFLVNGKYNTAAMQTFQTSLKLSNRLYVRLV